LKVALGVALLVAIVGVATTWATVMGGGEISVTGKLETDKSGREACADHLSDRMFLRAVVTLLIAVRPSASANL
jgi:hypothetical protein